MAIWFLARLGCAQGGPAHQVDGIVRHLVGYDGVAVDARGRTVLEFDAFDTGVRSGDSIRSRNLDGHALVTDADESATVAPGTP